jgi:Domain of Unknown Function with PDB structure (DUF3857)/Transglutaminase-like superfamily
MFYYKYFKCLLFTTVVISAMTTKTYCQDKDIPKELYTASGIPDSLKEDANSVVRYSMDDITIKGPGKLFIKHHSLVTVLNERGDKEAVIELSYNKKYDNYGFIDVRVYDTDGKLIKKYHKSDMYDGLASDNETLVTDERFLALKHSISKYPETIEVEYEETLTSFIDLPSWYVQDHLEQSVQNSQYKVSANPNIGFRYKNKNLSILPDKSNSGEYEVYRWAVKNIKAIKREDNSMSWTVLPHVLFAVNKFEFYGVPGDLSNWENYGKWQQVLNTDVCTLSDQRIQEIKKMTDTIKTDKQKAKFLYKYMQQSMRYVSIQLGLGGFKPFPATFVDEKKYGDCKALSNYMRALLKAVGINSYYTIINAGTNAEPADYSFAHNPFNHVILCVPFKNDTTWLECTSSTQPFGELGSFTENRHALVVTEDGGKLINTPKSTTQENQFNSEAHIKLEADGSAKAEIRILSTGEYRDMYVEMAAVKMDEQKEFLLRTLDIKQPSIFDFTSGKDVEGVKELSLSLEYDKFCDVMAGDKQFYKPLVFNLWGVTAPITEKRKTDYYFEHPMQKSCITTIDLPAGFDVETMPSNVSLKFSYGNYEVKYAYNIAKNQVVSTAKFILNNQVIPAAKYTEMQQYMDGIAKAQNKKLVIHKKA